MSKKKLFTTTLILSAAVLIFTFLVSCASQLGNIQNASEARDAALSYLDNRYTDSVPGKGLTWQEHNTTPEGLIGGQTREFISSEWMVTVSYPVVLPENTVYDVVIINMKSGWHWKGNVNANGTVTELNPLEQLTKEDSQNIALEYVRHSPTFVFDGIEDTLELTGSIEISIPYTWTFIVRFESAHAGYGDRTGRMLAEVITPHEVSITIEQGEITYASMDNKWDMFTQKELSDGIDPDDVIIREESDITGMVTQIDPINSETVNGRILVELEQPNNTSDKFWVTIEKRTPIYEFDGQDHYTIPFNSLQTGQIVEVWFKGAVMESYPAQVNAKEVLVRGVVDYPEELTTSEKLWKDQGLRDYDFILERQAFAPEDWRGPVNIQVRNGIAVSVTYVSSGASVTEGKFDNADTIDKLFTMLKNAYAGKGDFEQKADTIDVTYNAQMGYPTTFFIDVSQMMADEEQGYTVTNFVAR